MRKHRKLLSYDEVMSLKVEGDLLKLLDKIALSENRSRSSLVRDLIYERLGIESNVKRWSKRSDYDAVINESLT